MNQPRLWFISRSYPPVVGGMERHNAELARALADHFAVRLVANPRGKPALPIFMPWAFLRLLVGLRRGDRVLFGDILTASLAGPLRKLRPGMAWFAAAHGTDVVWPPRWYQGLVKSVILPSMTGVSAVSRSTEEALLQRALAPSRSAVIGNGIPVDEGPPDRATARAWLGRQLGRSVSAEEGPFIVLLGRQVPRKGTRWFVEVVAPLLEQLGPGGKILVGGAGPELSAIREAAEANNLSEQVLLMGQLTEAEGDTLLAAGDLFVMPNKPRQGETEGFGITILKAAAAGLPVVASDQEGIRDAAAGGKVADLVSAADPSTFAQKVDAWLADPAARIEQGRKARQYVREYCTWKQVAARYAALLKRRGP